MLGLRLKKLPFNLSGFKQEIINGRAEHCRLLKIIITKKKTLHQTVNQHKSSELLPMTDACIDVWTCHLSTLRVHRHRINYKWKING